MALHFLEKYGIMAVKCPSKFDLRRVCRATGARRAGQGMHCAASAAARAAQACPRRRALSRPAPGATALVKLQTPSADEIGFVKSIAVQEIGGTKCCVLQQDSSQGQVWPGGAGVL